MMEVKEMLDNCKEAVAKVGEDAQVLYTIPGKRGKRNRHRLYKGGPLGTIVHDYKDGTILVRYKAQEIIDAVEPEYQAYLKSLPRGAKE